MNIYHKYLPGDRVTFRNVHTIPKTKKCSCCNGAVAYGAEEVDKEYTGTITTVHIGISGEPPVVYANYDLNVDGKQWIGISEGRLSKVEASNEEKKE